MTKPVDLAALEETLAALVSQPHNNSLAHMTFAEAMRLSAVDKLVADAILHRALAADDDEAEVRAELVLGQIKFIAQTVKSVSDHYHHTQAPFVPISTKLMRARLDELSASLIQDLAILGVAYVNEFSNSKLHARPASL